MALAAKSEEPCYTYADYLEWDEGERIELIDGRAYKMGIPLEEFDSYQEPAMQAVPSTAHQLISGEIFRQIANYLVGKRCKVIAAPFAVRLFEQDGSKSGDIKTVVEPDLMVTCDPSRIDRNGYRGAPDLVIEILSPSSRRHDWLIKMQQYQKAGVKEYWIVNPADAAVHVFLHDGSTLVLREVYGRTEQVKAGVLEGCVVDLSIVFPEAEE